MAQKKFKPKSGNPAKAAEELRAFKKRTQREEQERARAAQERKEALAEGRWDVETNGMYRNAPREAAPQAFSFNVKNDGSSSGTTYTPKTTLTPATKLHSNFVPRTDLDDVIDPKAGIRVTKSGKEKRTLPKTGMTGRKAGQIALATVGVGAMVVMGFLVPSMGGAISTPGMGGSTDTGLATDEDGNVVLVDQNGVPLDAEVDFGSDDTGVITQDGEGEAVEVEVNSEGNVSDNPVDTSSGGTVVETDSGE